jgi:predicted MPP superfamily phosphohydrolase
MDSKTHGKPVKWLGINRRKALQLIAAGMAGTAASLWDAFELEPEHLSITRQEIPVKTLPPGLDRLRIGLLSDFHFRPGDDDDLIDRVVARVRQENLDLITLTGDYLSYNPAVVAPLLAHLQNLTASHGIFAVMGNHDGWRGKPSLIRQQFEKAGLSFLINENSRISVRGDSLAIAGTDFVWKGKPDPQRALKGIPQNMPVLALVHEPDYFDTMTVHRDIQLQVSGHTHGGQCRVPVVGYAPRRVAFGRKYLEDYYRDGDSNLFVTRGVGTVGVRARFACPPELAILTLRESA